MIYFNFDQLKVMIRINPSFMDGLQLKSYYIKVTQKWVATCSGFIYAMKGMVIV